MRNNFSSASGGNQQGSSNAMIQSNVTFSRTRAGASNLLNHPRISSPPPTNQPNMQFEINMMGNMTDCNFYIPDAAGDTTGMAFRVAYNAKYTDTKELSVCVGSMLCSVVPAFRNNVEAALNGIGIRPRFVSLPSQARQNNIEISKVPALDWTSILVIFGYCILILFNIHRTSGFAVVGHRLRTKQIDELRTKVGCPHYHHSRIPFQHETELSVRTMLGTHALRNSIITFLMDNFNHSNQQISSLCQYLSYVLSWSGDLCVFTLMNERLVKTKSPVLSDSRVVAEAENLEELIKAIASHTYPQYFNHLCITSELFYLDVSRFPNLFAVAKVLEKGDDCMASLFYEISGMNKNTVVELVKLHRAAMAQNRVSTVTRIEPIVEI
ncbi:unnamed protein product [Trifolium pratense]|uniref:Uncharacterized protein n=1 Tax=Trifolium pratense TaxID=57577 RepID=A0ACB0L2S3_TRIPR|nr:unnamed protein product [Trifolium pratense]